MRLLHSPTSPYVRKVMASAIHLGLAGQITCVSGHPSPVKPDPAVSDVNPLGKVPAATLDDGTVLLGSRTICEWLAGQGTDAGFLPASGPGRWAVLELHDLADGILDAALLARYESAVRPETLRWSDWQSGQMAKIDAALARLNVLEDRLAGPVTLGSITAGAALGYLDFRFADHPWRAANPRLAAWWAEFGETVPMAQTRPV